MTSEHLLSFDRVWRDEKWREIQASISLFKFLIMEVSLSLNGWSIWVFFFSFFSNGLLCHCVFVLKGRNDLTNKKIKVWFWSYQCSLLSFGQIRWKSNGYYADLRGWANGGGGCQKAALQYWLVQANKADFLLWFGVFLDKDGVACNPCPPFPSTSLKLVHSFFYHSSFVLLKKAPQGFCSMFAHAPA